MIVTRGINSRIGRRGQLLGSGAKFTPASLFSNGEQGAWYDPSDLNTLFQDSAGTTPVTSDGDPVGYMGDKSGNDNHATQATSAARPTYHTDGTLHWLEFDGVDDTMKVFNTITMGNKAAMWAAAEKVSAGDDIERIYDSSDKSPFALRYKNDGKLDFAIGNFTLDSGRLLFSFTNDTNPHIFAFQRDQAGNIATIRADGSIVETGTHDQGSKAFNIIIGDTNRMLYYGGVILGSQYLDNDKALQLDQYLAKKSGITL